MDEAMNRGGQTATEWLDELFEFESCDVCGLDGDEHVAIMLLGRWFALCDPKLPTGQVHLRDIRLHNNAGMDFPVCAEHEEPLDVDKTRLVTTSSFEDVTCQCCKAKATVRYPWAYHPKEA